MPELKKASGHSNPEVRDKALVALGVIQRGQQRNAPDSPVTIAIQVQSI